ncbi:ATP-binding protein [Candidatus Gottesmanbacteria bacterium]|nr:ATP-binding protein [Candidatus Gottesmanbacteria bacterium]
MVIPRSLFQEIGKYLHSRQAIVVTGMRRVGKTTLLQYFYEKIPSSNKIFLDLEDPLNQAIFEPDNYQRIKTAFELRGLDFSQKAYIFLDEIQLVPKIPSLVKYFYDHYDIKFFLTGSASFYLKNLFSESLAGRKYLFELYPLDFSEFLLFKGLNLKLPDFSQQVDKQTYELFSPQVSEYLELGGMPEVVLLSSQEEKQRALRDIFSSYFQKEIEVLGDFRKNETVRNLIFLLARRTGQKLDIQRISQELGIARQTLYEYLDFLSGTYLVSLLPALGKIDVSVRKQKKVYFIDSGFFSILEKPLFGSVFENAVFNNLRSYENIYYFSQDNQEVDFVVKLPSFQKVVFEVKETATISDIKKLEKRGKRLVTKTAFVVSFNFCREKEVKYLFQIPKLRTYYLTRPSARVVIL